MKTLNVDLDQTAAFNPVIFAGDTETMILKFYKNKALVSDLPQYEYLRAYFKGAGEVFDVAIPGDVTGGIPVQITPAVSNLDNPDFQITLESADGVSAVKTVVRGRLTIDRGVRSAAPSSAPSAFYVLAHDQGLVPYRTINDPAEPGKPGALARDSAFLFVRGEDEWFRVPLEPLGPVQ